MKIFEICKLFLTCLYKDVYFIHYKEKQENGEYKSVLDSYTDFIKFYTAYDSVKNNENCKDIYVVFR